MTQELTLITKAATLVVNSTESLTQAADLLGKIKKVQKATEAAEKVLAEKLAKTVIAKEHAKKREMRLKLDKAIKFISDQVNKYQTQEARRAAAETAKVVARVEAGNIKMETGIRKLDAIEKPVDTIETATGTANFRTIPKLDIIDEALIPREYLIVDEVKLFAALKGGVTVPGAQIIQVQSITNR